MADRERKRGRGDESKRGKDREENRKTDERGQWGIHVQLGSHLSTLHEEEERLYKSGDSGRVADHRKLQKKIRIMLDLISYELRHRAEVLRLIRQEGIEDDDGLVREFLKYQLKKHRCGSTSSDPHGAGPSRRSPLKGASPSASDGEPGDDPQTNEDLGDSDDDIIFQLAPPKMQKKGV